MILSKIKAHFGVEVLVQAPSGELSRIKISRNSGHVVGDKVQVTDGRLTRLDRENELIRKTPFGNQVIAANLNYVGIVISYTPKTPNYFIDQIIVSCRSVGIEPFILVTKLDKSESGDFFGNIKSIYQNSVPVLAGVTELKTFLKPARYIFVGVSGAGKSTLINHLIPDAAQKVGSLSEHSEQGRHTTSGSLLLDLPGGGELIDSPGVRDFTPVDLNAEELARYFPGFENLMDRPCRFRNCKHLTDPGCAIREYADPKVYQRYLDFKTQHGTV
ncbi:MAG: ribosome small subunit-dependent GTPase A [Myxococcota bacterium]